MPVLGDHKSEMDRAYTPLEAKRRANMSLRDVRYGFYKVVTDAIPEVKCFTCDQSINSNGLIINGTPYHGSCFRSTR